MPLLALAAIFVVLLAGVAFYMYRPVAAPMQAAPTLKKVGILRYVKDLKGVEDGFVTGMSQLGYKEGRDVEYIFSEYGSSPGDMKGLAAQLLSQHVDIIVAVTNVAATGAVAAEKDAGMTSIPIVFLHGNNPVGTGLVQSFKSSGNNLTGVAVNYAELTERKLQMLQSINPKAKRVAIFDTVASDPAMTSVVKTLDDVAPKFNITVVRIPVKNQPGDAAIAEIKDALAKMRPGDVDAIFYLPGPVANQEAVASLITSEANRLKIPTIGLVGALVENGQLFSYEHNLSDIGEQGAVMTVKILHGVAPSDIPIEFPPRDTMTINLQTAKVIGVTIPKDLTYVADKIIQADSATSTP